jgi:molecular chaperone DnaJ
MKFSGGCPPAAGRGAPASRTACGGQAAQIPTSSGPPRRRRQRLQVRGLGGGNAGRNGGPPGDLYIVIEVAPTPFPPRGANIRSGSHHGPEATLGAKIDVPTLWGKTTIRLPPGTKSGQKFRIKEQGAPLPGRKGRGDEHAEVYIVPPPFEDERVREIMKELEKISGPDPREKTGMS